MGNKLKVSVFGQSHGEAVGVVVDGLPAGMKIDLEQLQAFLNRRAPGRTVLFTPRREEDKPRILSGLYEGYTCGAPLAAVIENGDISSEDYVAKADMHRPSHADYSARMRYGDHFDPRGGGHFSGRLTAPLCIAGGIALHPGERGVFWVRISRQWARLDGVMTRVNLDTPGAAPARHAKNSRAGGRGG